VEAANVDALRLSIRSGNERTLVMLDSAHRFTLPAGIGPDSTLVANRSRGKIVVTPLILSPGTSEADRRLGDLRLQCHVYWAITQDQVSIFARGLFGAAGGCSGTKFGFYVTAARPIASALAMEGQRTFPVQIWAPRNYRVPIGEKALSNDAHIRLSYGDPSRDAAAGR
jgi:hypothetical protein